jgi:iron(III) transport system permease protein
MLLGVVMETGLKDRNAPSGYSLRGFIDLYTSPFVHAVIGNTVLFATISTITALLFAVPTAWLVQRTTLPHKGLAFGLMLVTALVPGYVTAQAWLLMFHPRIGLANRWLVESFDFVDTAPLNVINVPAMGVINGLGLSSVAFLMLAGVFRADPALDESARVHGVGVCARLKRITLPLAYPGILAVVIFITMLSLASIDIPRVIGLSGTIFLFSTAISGDFLGATRAASVLFVLLGLGMSWWYFRTIRHAHRYAVVTGGNYNVHLIPLSRTQVSGA